MIALVVYGQYLDDPRPRITGVDATASSPAATSAEEPARPLWPSGASLIEAAEALGQRAAIENWKVELSRILAELGRVTSLSDGRIADHLAALEQLSRQIEPLIVANSSVPVKEPQLAQGTISDDLRRLQHRLRIRIDVWRAVHELASVTRDSMGDTEDAENLPSLVDPRGDWLPTLDPYWREYLGLERLQSAWSQEPPQRDELQRAARHTLARLSSPILNGPQNDYLRQHVPPVMVEWLIGQAREECDLARLLQHLEVFLDSRHGYHAACLAEDFQKLLWHYHPKHRALADQIERNLRQANLRISASEQFLNLLVPDVPEVVEPVRENIMGAHVSGRSRIANRLQIRLLPDPDQINLRLDAIGLVRSSTQASRGGFVVDNLGTTRFQASKPFAIGRHGLFSGPPQAQADSDSQVVGMRSNFDGIPLLAGLARRMAHQQIATQKSAAHYQMNQRVERTVMDRLDLEIEGQLDEMRSFFFHHVIQPLIALDLEPLPVETRTTHDRMIMQYRLAGIDQLAAASTRPGGVQSSLLSMQVHQSALNNLLSRIQLSGRVLTPDELTKHLVDVFGLKFTTSDQAIDIEARMEFAPYDPICVVFEDGMVGVRLNLRQLQVGRGKVWKGVTITSRYTPHVRGTQLFLEQESAGIRLSGSQFNGRDQLAIRGIFNAIFQTHYEVQLIPKWLEQRLGRPMMISQFESIDGWLGISLDAAPAPSLSPRQARIGLFERP